MADLHEQHLARQAAGGDRDALDQLLRACYAQVYALCRRMSDSDADAADATQEALIAIARGIHSFNGSSAIRTWIYRVTSNACLDEIRRRRRRPTPADPHALIEPMDLVDGMAQLDDHLELDAALARLSDDHRTAIVLRDVLGLEYDEIATTLGVPIGTVRSRINRARQRLADDLGLHDPGPPAGNSSAPLIVPPTKP